MLDFGNVEKLVGEPQRGLGQAVGSAHPTPPAGWPCVTVIAFLLALSGIFGLQGYLGSTTGNLPHPQLETVSADRPTLKTTPIEQIRVGQRVLTKGEAPDKTLETVVAPRTWRHLTLEETETWPDGTVDRICIESILPPDWLAQFDGAPVGSTVPIPLDLEEMGLPEGMTAQVVANEPCPPISMAPGRVVLTTVNHLNTRVVELTLAAPDGTQETVRPTAFHKFYSETRGQWLPAEDLQPDERLRGLHTPLQVVSLAPVPGTHRVYNMTVEGEHVYHVSTLGVLAHNQDCAPKLPRYSGGKTSGVLRYGDADVPLLSGYRGPSASLPRGTPGMNGRIKSHVEAHAAAIMRQEGLTEATLYINRVPCPGKTGCRAMLARMLPEGARLRVIGPGGFDEVFIGLPD